MDDLLRDFLTESGESLTIVDGEMVKLEAEPNNKEVLQKIFRLVHTIKGTCGFIGLSRLEKVAHASENVLGKFRDGVLQVTPDAVTLIFESLDSIAAKDRELRLQIEQGACKSFKLKRRRVTAALTQDIDYLAIEPNGTLRVARTRLREHVLQ